MTNGPSLRVGVDVSGVRRELDSLVREVDRIQGSLNSGAVGIDTASAKRDLNELEKQAKSLKDILGGVKQSDLGDLGADAVVDALERATETAKTLEAVLQHTGGPSSGLAEMAKQARSAEDGIKRTTRAQEVLAREGIKLSRQQTREAKASYDQLRQSGARGTGRLRNMEFDDWLSGGWRNHSINEREASRHRADVLRRMGIELPPAPGGAGGKGPSGRGDRFKRLGGAAAGALGGTAAGMFGGGDGGLWGKTGGALGAGLGMGAGFMFGGPVGAAVGAFAGQLLGGLGSSMDGMIGRAGEEGSTYSDLRQSLGAVTADFDMLRGSVRHFTDGLGVAYNESARLAAEFARTASLQGSGMSIGADLRTSIGFGRSYGLAPADAVRFMGSMRHIGATGDDRDSRRLALMIGEAVNSGGTQARMGEVLSAVQSLATNAARASLTSPDVGAISSFMSSLTGLNLHGMKGDPGAAMAAMSSADAAMRQGGAFGEASKNFSLGVWQRLMPDFNALDMGFVNEQGAFGSLEKAFGRKSAAYGFAATRGDTALMDHYDRLASRGGNRSILSHQMEAMEKFYGGNTNELRNAIMTHFGVGESGATALYRAYRTDGGLGGLEGVLRGSGVNVENLNTKQIASLAELAGADAGGLNAQAAKLESLQGSDALSKEEREKLEAARGSQEELRKVVLQLTAMHDTSDDQGNQMRRMQADMGNILQKLATELIPLTMTIKDGIIELVKYLPGETEFERKYAKDEAAKREEQAKAGRLDREIGDLAKQVSGFKEDSPEQQKTKAASLSSLLTQRAAAQARGDSTSVAAFDNSIKLLQDDIRAHSPAGKQDLIDRHNRAVRERNAIASLPSAYSPLDPAGAPASASAMSMVSPAKPRRGMKLTPEEMAYLAETDRLLGAKPGTSAAQIMVESGNDPNAVSSKGATGLAQLYPPTKRSLERQLGRPIVSRMDQLLAHRMVMQENLARYGSLEDAQRAYNGGTNPAKWGNPETAAYVDKINATRDGFDRKLPNGAAAAAATPQAVMVRSVVEGSVRVLDGSGRPTGQEIPITQVGAPRAYGGRG